jgi:hypothetical protein
VYGQHPIYEHCMPFDLSRAYDEASGIADPRVWTAERCRDVALARELKKPSRASAVCHTERCLRRRPHDRCE